MQNHAHRPAQPDSWSMTYKGQHLTVERHRHGWRVYLNRVMDTTLVFFDARTAANWLRRTVDAGVT